MRTLAQGWGLALDSGRLWLSRLPMLGAWFLVGWLAKITATHLAVELGGRHRTWAALVFVLGAITQVMTLVAMIHALKPNLRSPRLISQHKAGRVTESAVPRTVLHRERLLDTLFNVIGPFLAVYAVWNIIEQWVAELFWWNTAVNPIGFANDSWSVSLEVNQFKLYAVIAGAALVARTGLEFLAHRRHGRWARLPLVFAEGLWTFALFFITVIGLRWLDLKKGSWAIYRESVRLRHQLVDLLPDWHLPFGWMLPDAVVAAVGWTTQELLPAVWTSFVLPLVWLSLTATVLGWRGFRLTDVLAGRLPAGWQPLEASSSVGRAAVLVGGAITADLRDKYLPVLHSLALVSRSGPRLLGVFVVAYAALQWLLSWLQAAMLTTFAAHDEISYVRRARLVELPGQFIVQTLTAALLVTAFDRGLVGWLRREPIPSSAIEGEVPDGKGAAGLGDEI